MKKQYVFATRRSQETVDKYFFVSLSRFQQLLDDVGRYRVIRDAIAEKVGTIPDRASEWKLKFHDPTKKRDFKVCTCCAKIAETRTGAVAAGNATLFNQVFTSPTVISLVRPFTYCDASSRFNLKSTEYYYQLRFP